MSAKLCRVKPLAATASPVNALSSDITTGMSAPPMGSTNATPSTSARTISEMNENGTEATARTAIAKPRIAAASTPFTSCWPGYVMGVPVISSCSLAKATMLPANEMDPMMMVNTLGKASAIAGLRPK